MTDCLGLLQQVERSEQVATSHHRPLARLWALLFAALDHQIPADWLVWMPAHGSRACVGRALKSDGSPVTAQDWCAKRLVDGLAKLAAEQYRTPKALRGVWQIANRTAEYAAALLGLQTKAANTYTETRWKEDGTAYLATLRDAMARPRWAIGGSVRPHTHGQRGPTAVLVAPQAAQATQPISATPVRIDKLKRQRAKVAADALSVQAEVRFQHAWHTRQAVLQRRPQERPASERLEELKQRVLAQAAANRANG